MCSVPVAVGCSSGYAVVSAILPPAGYRYPCRIPKWLGSVGKNQRRGSRTGTGEGKIKIGALLFTEGFRPPRLRGQRQVKTAARAVRRPPVTARPPRHPPPPGGKSVRPKPSGPPRPSAPGMRAGSGGSTLVRPFGTCPASRVSTTAPEGCLSASPHTCGLRRKSIFRSTCQRRA